MTPAKFMRDDAIARELAGLEKQWSSLFSKEGGGGSPGEWMWERMGELEHEQQQRLRGVQPNTDVPLQSK